MSRKILLLLGLSLIVLSSCELKEPVLPEWDIVAKIPFAVDDLILGERLVADSLSDTSSTASFRVDNSSILYISLRDSLELESISRETLSLKPEDLETSVDLDTLEMNEIADVSTPLIPLGAIFPELSQVTGFPITIPDTTINPPDVIIEPTDFSRIRFASGIATLTLANNLPFTIGPNSITPSGLIVTVRGAGDAGDPFATFVFPTPIDSAGTQSVSVNIGEKEIITPIEVSYEIPIVGPETFDVTNEILENSGFTLTFALDNVRAVEATAILEPQMYSDIIKIGYDSQTRLSKATIESGEILIDFVNRIDLPSTVSVTVPAITRADGAPFLFDFFIPTAGVYQVPIRLRDDELSNPDDPGALIDSIAIHVDAMTLRPDELVSVTASDSVEIDVSSDTLFFGGFAGFLAPDTLDIDPVFERDLIDYSGFDGDIELQQATLELTLLSGVFVENLAADIAVSGYHTENGVITDSSSLVLNNLVFVAGEPSSVSVSGPEIVEFLKVLPNDIRFSGEVRVSGNANLARGDNIGIRYRFDTPMIVDIGNDVTFEGDTTSFEINEEFREAAANQELQDAILSIDLFNHTPLGGTVQIYLSTDFTDNNLYDANFDSTRGFIETVTIAPAPVDAGGLVTTEGTNQVSFTLDAERLRLFEQRRMRVGYSFDVDPTGGFVTIRYSDYVRMLGAAEITYRIEDE